MMRKGFTYIDVIISIMITAVAFTVLSKALLMRNQVKVNLNANELLTVTMINCTEAFKKEVSNGNDISGYPSYIGECKGNVNVYKDYLVDGSAVYIITFNLRYKSSALIEQVIIYANEN